MVTLRKVAENFRETSDRLTCQLTNTKELSIMSVFTIYVQCADLQVFTSSPQNPNRSKPYCGAVIRKIMFSSFGIILGLAYNAKLRISLKTSFHN
jgi:hypothetical protein